MMGNASARAMAMIGNKIAYYRKMQGMTQEALAQQLGVTNQAVSKWELEQACPDVMLLPALADIFGVTIDVLFGREPKKQAPVCGDVSWPDDGVLRVVVYEGRKLICGGEVAEDFKLEYRQNVKEVLSAVTVTCGDVKGNVRANCHVNCGEVGGDVDAGTSVTCSDIGGDAGAGMNVNCGNAAGSVDAGASVRCQSVSGDIDAGGKVQIG